MLPATQRANHTASAPPTCIAPTPAVGFSRLSACIFAALSGQVMAQTVVGTDGQYANAIALGTSHIQVSGSFLITKDNYHIWQEPPVAGAPPLILESTGSTQHVIGFDAQYGCALTIREGASVFKGFPDDSSSAGVITNFHGGAIRIEGEMRALPSETPGFYGIAIVDSRSRVHGGGMYINNRYGYGRIDGSDFIDNTAETGSGGGYMPFMRGLHKQLLN